MNQPINQPARKLMGPDPSHLPPHPGERIQRHRITRGVAPRFLACGSMTCGRSVGGEAIITQSVLTSECLVPRRLSPVLPSPQGPDTLFFSDGPMLGPPCTAALWAHSCCSATAGAGPVIGALSARRGCHAHRCVPRPSARGEMGGLGRSCRRSDTVTGCNSNYTFEELKHGCKISPDLPSPPHTVQITLPTPPTARHLQLSRHHLPPKSAHLPGDRPSPRPSRRPAHGPVGSTSGS